MQNRTCLKPLIILTLSSLLLTGCDTYPYKEKIQEVYDNHNPTGDKAKCMMVGSVTQSMYPYTTFYMQGQDLPFSSSTQKANYNRLKNDSLHLFAGIGFFTEEYAGEVDGRATYRYDLTDLGRKYVDWTFGETNFCFGRVVVDKINRTKDTINGVGGAQCEMSILLIILKMCRTGSKIHKYINDFDILKNKSMGNHFPGFTVIRCQVMEN